MTEFRVAEYRTRVVHTVNEARTEKGNPARFVVTYCGNRAYAPFSMAATKEDKLNWGWKPQQEARMSGGWKVYRGGDELTRYQRLCQNCDETIT